MRLYLSVPRKQPILISGGGASINEYFYEDKYTTGSSTGRCWCHSRRPPPSDNTHHGIRARCFPAADATSCGRESPPSTSGIRVHASNIAGTPSIATRGRIRASSFYRLISPLSSLVLVLEFCKAESQSHQVGKQGSVDSDMRFLLVAL